jgi:cytochrome c biogenesis protein CcdA
MIGIKVVTLITAFGIALVKAYLVAKNFMHINVEKRFIPYIVGTVLVFMLLFFAGAAPDVMKKQGTQWEKPSWLAASAHSPAAADEGAHH